MRKILIATAAIGALSLAACSQKTQDTTEAAASSAVDDMGAYATDAANTVNDASDTAAAAAGNAADAAKDAAADAKDAAENAADAAQAAANDAANEMADHTDGDPKTN